MRKKNNNSTEIMSRRFRTCAKTITQKYYYMYYSIILERDFSLPFAIIMTMFSVKMVLYINPVLLFYIDIIQNISDDLSMGSFDKSNE